MGTSQSLSVPVVDPPAPLTTVSFVLNGDEVVVENASPLLSLNDWLRSQPGLAGTKRMCAEGGCGCCVVTASLQQAAEEGWECLLLPQQGSTISINSCLCPLYAVDGWHITTVEGVGSSSSGFHAIQVRLADYNGTQCGYCTPGFVMSMYSLLQSNPTPTKQQVEDNFDGHICRCTGYRSILDAMKSFAIDSEEPLCADIEDLGGNKICPKSGKSCRGNLMCSQGNLRSDSDPAWYSPTSIAQLAALFTAKPDSKFKLVAGDTGRGVYKDSAPVEMLVSLSRVTELHNVQLSDKSLTVGAATSLSSLIGLLESNAEKSSHFAALASHLSKIANVPVRNVATWAGNIMLVHAHSDFPSDVFLLLAASQAVLTIGSVLNPSSLSTHSLWELLTVDMSSLIILSVELPFMADTVKFKSYKVMPRAENAAAYASAAFSLTVESSDSYTISGQPTLVIGGGNFRPLECLVTEKFLIGKDLLDESTLKGCMETLTKELNASPSAHEFYKIHVVTGLLYKFYLNCIGAHCSSAVKSASASLVRPVSSGSQQFTPTTSEFPVGEPINKLAAKLQASGEAQYTTDLPILPNELAAAFVLTTKAGVEILSMDTSVAETMPGFVKILTATDIPIGGTNNVGIPSNGPFQPEELFADYRSEYVGQAAALVLADSYQNAEKIAKAVTFEYGESSGSLVVDTQDAVERKSLFPEPNCSIKSGDAKGALSKSDMHIEGQIECGSQYHFTMETQTALVVPVEGETYAVYSSTQWASYVQAAVANVLGIPSSSVDVSVRRVGGAYGSKITRANCVAAACALGAHVTQRPVRMHMDLETNMKLLGKRLPFFAKYQVAFSKQGIINGIIVDIFGNAGLSVNDNSMYSVEQHIDNAYHVENWEINCNFCKTNLAMNTACRSPGTLPAIFIMESITDHVARTLGMDIGTVKKINLYKQDQITPTGVPLKYCNIGALWDQLYKSAEVESREAEIAAFNKANRWMKRGISMVPLKFKLDIVGVSYTVLVSIYASDGTVAISHGGVEVGQGIDTKVCQVAALTLAVPMDKIKIKPCSTLTNPNSLTTGGSTTSELTCLGTIKACQMLMDRIKPVKDKNPDLSWKDLIALCYSQSVDLSAKFCVTGSEAADYYFSYGATVTEVKLDVLTGQILIPRVDLLYDCGNSMNPKIDIGQVEGAFVMGLGYWLSEKVDYDKTSGAIKTFNTWTYKPPTCKDIPIDFRVELLKNAPNPVGVLGSKAVGEPPICMSCSALFAVKRAIEEARKDIGVEDFFALNGPATVDVIHGACMVDPKYFTL